MDEFTNFRPLLCSVDGCEKGVRARGWCINHWQLWRRNGDPLVQRRKTVAECGTETGYNRHRRSGEPACSDCLQAWNAALKEDLRLRKIEKRFGTRKPYALGRSNV